MTNHQSFQIDDPALHDALANLDSDIHSVGHSLSFTNAIAEVLVTNKGWVEVYDTAEGRLYVPSIWGGFGPVMSDLSEALELAGANEEGVIQ